MTEIIHEIEAAIVPVRIHTDNRKESKRYLRSTLKSYTIDPTTNLTVQVLPYNPRRYMAIVTSNDSGAILTKDNPAPASQTDSAASPPQGASLHLATMSVGFPGYEYYGPDPLWAVAITGGAATRISVIQHIWCYDD
jgi:hypothetical protein